MDAPRYRLRLVGLREDAGCVRAATLERVLAALRQTAERATRLVVTGAGAGRGRRPDWLEATMDVMVTGLSSGSTNLEIAAPRIGHAAPEPFAQQDFWRDGPKSTDTALDFAARAITEVQNAESVGEFFDDSVLEAVLEFSSAARNARVHYQLIPHDRDREGFTLDDDACVRIGERRRSLPAPRAFVVSGTLDEIRHSKRGFRLLVGPRGRLLGQLAAEATDAEALRPLWGKRVIVSGMVHFRADGRPRFIDAERLAKGREEDSVFEELPSVEVPDAPLLPPAAERQARSADFMALWGAWPGDEPIEDLMDQLD